jgi:hypothetical protein
LDFLRDEDVEQPSVVAAAFCDVFFGVFFALGLAAVVELPEEESSLLPLLLRTRTNLIARTAAVGTGCSEAAVTYNKSPADESEEMLTGAPSFSSSDDDDEEESSAKMLRKVDLHAF